MRLCYDGKNTMIEVSMIIWINGAFGSGKTQTAYELNKRLEHSFVFDPEEAGFYIGKNIPKSIECGDFQDFELWREFNKSMLEFILNEYEGTIICPMTVTNIDYYNEIVEGFQDEIDFRGFVLNASKETLAKRLKSRGEFGSTWAVKKIDHCIESFKLNCFGQVIETDHMSIDEVVNEIAEICNLKLLPDRRSSFRKTIDRLKVFMNHIR